MVVASSVNTMRDIAGDVEIASNLPRFAVYNSWQTKYIKMSPFRAFPATKDK